MKSLPCQSRKASAVPGFPQAGAEQLRRASAAHHPARRPRGQEQPCAPFLFHSDVFGSAKAYVYNFYFKLREQSNNRRISKFLVLRHSPIFYRAVRVVPLALCSSEQVHAVRGGVVGLTRQPTGEETRPYIQRLHNSDSVSCTIFEHHSSSGLHINHIWIHVFLRCTHSLTHRPIVPALIANSPSPISSLTHLPHSHHSLILLAFITHSSSQHSSLTHPPRTHHSLTLPALITHSSCPHSSLTSRSPERCRRPTGTLLQSAHR